MHTLRNPVVGIDPGISGALVYTNGNYFDCVEMPFRIEGKDKLVDCKSFGEILSRFNSCSEIFLERPVSFGMGTKGAFTYGRGFEAILIAIERHHMPLTLVEPAKWTKVMHAGISSDLKPKAKSAIAVKRLFPKLVGKLPRNSKGTLHDGAVDALLIAGYGLRQLGTSDDFY